MNTHSGLSQDSHSTHDATCASDLPISPAAVETEALPETDSLLTARDGEGGGSSSGGSKTGLKARDGEGGGSSSGGSKTGLKAREGEGGRIRNP